MLRKCGNRLKGLKRVSVRVFESDEIYPKTNKAICVKFQNSTLRSFLLGYNGIVKITPIHTTGRSRKAASAVKSRQSSSVGWRAFF